MNWCNASRKKPQSKASMEKGRERAFFQRQRQMTEKIVPDFVVNNSPPKKIKRVDEEEIATKNPNTPPLKNSNLLSPSTPPSIIKSKTKNSSLSDVELIKNKEESRSPTALALIKENYEDSPINQMPIIYKTNKESEIEDTLKEVNFE